MKSSLQRRNPPQTLPRSSPSDEMPSVSVEKKRAPRGPRGDRGVTLARIQQAARASFAAHGWEGTSLRAIAREVGVDAALVHYYFSSKEALLDAVTNPPEAWLESIRTTTSRPVRERG